MDKRILRNTAYGAGVGVLLWALLVGTMLTNPKIKSTNPGVYEVIQAIVPWTDPVTGEKKPGMRYLPL